MPTVGPDLPPLSPAREDFRAPASQGNLIPIVAELIADTRHRAQLYCTCDPGPTAFPPRVHFSPPSVDADPKTEWLETSGQGEAPTFAPVSA
jgi:hypothetical protein